MVQKIPNLKHPFWAEICILLHQKKQSKKEPTLGEELNGTYTPKTGNKIETPEVSPKDEFSKKTKRGSKELSSEISEYLDKKLGYGFSTEVERVAKNVGVNAKDLVAIMAAESGLNPDAGKGKSAVGLFQFTSSAAKQFNTDLNTISKQIQVLI